MQKLLLFFSIFLCSILSNANAQNWQIAYDAINRQALLRPNGDTLIPFGPYIFIFMPDEQGMIKVQTTEGFGYIDTTLQERIAPIYKRLSFFYQERAYAKKDGKYGFIDRYGNTVISFQYDDAKDFNSFGIAEVKLNNRFYFIDTAGNILTLPAYDFSIYTRHDSILVLKRKNRSTFFSYSGHLLRTFKNIDLPYNNSYPTFFTNNGPMIARYKEKTIYLDRNLRNVGPRNGYQQGDRFHPGGLTIVKNKKYGIINSKGDLLFPLRYDLIEFVNSTYYILSKGEDFDLLDAQGKRIAGPNLHRYAIDSYNNSGRQELLIRIQQHDKYGALSLAGDTLIPIIYDDIQHFSNDSIAIAWKNGKAGSINYKNEIRLPFVYTKMYPTSNTRYYIAVHEGIYSLVHYNGQIVIPSRYTFLNIISSNYGFEKIIAAQNGRFGLIDNIGDVLIPFQYDTLFEDQRYPGMLYFRKNGLYGLIADNGQIAIQPSYDTLSTIDNGLYVAGIGGRCGIYDIRMQQFIIPMEYSNLLHYKWSRPYFEERGTEYLLGKKDGRWQIFNTRNEVFASRRKDGQLRRIYTKDNQLSRWLLRKKE